METPNLQECVQDLLTTIASDRWETINEKKGITVSQKTDANSDFTLLKSVGTIKSSAQSIVDIVEDIENRGNWDLFFEEGQVVSREGDEGYAYLKFKGQWTVWPRDFALYLGKMFVDGQWVCVAKSVAHPEIPEKSGCVRGTILTSGFRVVPNEDDSECEVTMVIQVDLAGWLPTKISNLVNTYQPLGTIGIRKLLTGVSEE
eukprot:TRINITY_DN1394_c0_g1_i1.p1 TRINITY_DN1394_c0_g1~~TRINITY_DN1394_c0_g1_i1.p1  ORF type:complete len:234 (-),score=54.95 TRINITY_DN1394_c0_g1_i1:13-618(-)